MRKGGSVRRDRPGRREYRKLLIVTEGEVTEVQYLQGLLQHLRTTGVTVVPCTIRRGGGEPSRVLAKARDLASRSDYEAVWIVIDDDGHPALDDVLRQCVKSGETVIISRPQFEVWLLWHFTDSGAAQDTASLKRELRRYGFTGTCKHLPTNFPFHHVDQAVARSARTGRTAAPNTRGSNPSSAMPHLVEALRLG